MGEAMDEITLKSASTSPPGGPRLGWRHRCRPSLGAVHRLCPRPGPGLPSPPLVAHSRCAGRVGARSRGPPGLGGPTPPHGHTARPPPLRARPRQILSKGDRSSTGKDSAGFRNVEIRLGAATAASSERGPPGARPPAGPREGERGERGPGRGPRAGGGAGPGPSPRRPGRPLGPSRASRTSCQGNFNTSG